MGALGLQVVCLLSLGLHGHDRLDRLIQIMVMVVDDHCAPLLPWRPKSGHNPAPLGIVTETTPFSHPLARDWVSPAFSVRILEEPTARSLVAQVQTRDTVLVRELFRHFLQACLDPDWTFPPRSKTTAIVSFGGHHLQRHESMPKAVTLREALSQNCSKNSSPVITFFVSQDPTATLMGSEWADPARRPHRTTTRWDADTPIIPLSGPACFARPTAGDLIQIEGQWMMGTHYVTTEPSSSPTPRWVRVDSLDASGQPRGPRKGSNGEGCTALSS